MPSLSNRKCALQFALALAAIPCACTQNPNAGASSGIQDSARAADLLRLETDLSIIAADSMEGRAAGTIGAIRAQRYIESQLKRIGLLPMGERGTYEQVLRTVRRRVGNSALNVGQTQLTVWEDFVPLPWPWTVRPFTRAQTIYAGMIGDSIAADVTGKFVILSQPGPRTVFPRVGPGDPLSKAAAVALVGLEKFPAQRLAPIRAGLSAGLEGNEMTRAEVPPSILITTAAAEQLFGRTLEQLKRGDTGRTVNAAIAFVDSVERICCNIIAKLAGAEPSIAKEFVAVSAHIDHIGVAPNALDHDSLRAVNEKLWNLGRGVAPVDAPPGAGDQVHINLDSIHRAHGVHRDSIFNGAFRLAHSRGAGQSGIDVVYRSSDSSFGFDCRAIASGHDWSWSRGRFDGRRTAASRGDRLTPTVT
jgi:hypothetical protein